MNKEMLQAIIKWFENFYSYSEHEGMAAIETVRFINHYLDGVYDEVAVSVEQFIREMREEMKEYQDFVKVKDEYIDEAAQIIFEKLCEPDPFSKWGLFVWDGLVYMIEFDDILSMYEFYTVDCLYDDGKAYMMIEREN